VIAVVPPSSLHVARGILGRGAHVIEGGDTRRESVACGLGLAAASTVVVHDAVRPLVSAELVTRVVDALGEADGAVAAVPVEETIKRADDRNVIETVDRTNLWRAQTPQVFKTSVLRAAHDRAAAEGFEPTDDAQLVEWFGGHVVLVLGDTRNIKVTWPPDFELAESLLGTRR
jgi:2-C-methyl-D-erythritol 4-phosphate cytidylyltransferase